MKKYLGLFCLLGISLAAQADKPNGIWAWRDTAMAEQHKVLEEGLDHPCGATHRIELDKMPAADQAAEMGLELMLEYRGNRIINRWVTPIDSRPLAVDDENLIITHSAGALLINIHGYFNLTEPQPDTSTRLSRCPAKLQQAFPGAQYVHCVKLPDKISKKPRYLAYKGHCIEE
ncbi:MAG: hypothetical protein OEZ39_08825 [Gammaproteobacteria bacterium]|nr:hypothetical protein [Gammaproteobacteria bacterium]MDH5651967.1 hypothetical protein [Gammaproteobacteria bacterium]